jgi:hypothetical protein
MKKEGIQTRKRKQKNGGSISGSNGPSSSELTSHVPNSKSSKYSKNSSGYSSSGSSSRKAAKGSSSSSSMLKVADIQSGGAPAMMNPYTENSFNHSVAIINSSEDISNNIQPRNILMNNEE